jgi:hypothetical protein
MELHASMLRPIVGQALDASVAVPVEWSVVPILAGDRQGLGVFRVLGSARIGGAPRAWSVILKVLPGTLGSPTRWNYPAREALAYERGLLEDLAPGVEAPQCFGHMEHGSQHQLWLEDLGTDAIRWRLDDYGRRPDRSDGSTARISPGARCQWLGGSADSDFAPGWARVPPRCTSFLASDGTRSYSASIRPRSSTACYGYGRIVKSSSTRSIDCRKCSATTMHSVGICS